MVTVGGPPIGINIVAPRSQKNAETWSRDGAEAITASNPWNSFKALASKPGNWIQLVYKEELEAYIDSKARDKHDPAIASKKKQKPWSFQG